MTGMTAAGTTRPAHRVRPLRSHRRAARATLAVAALCAALALSGCGTGHPAPLAAGSLSEAQSFPYFRVYWVGSNFDGHPLAAADGLKSYEPTIGDSVYYGDCVQSKGVFGGGSCLLPLQVTTVIYALHPNAALGKQRNILVRGVPATVYDEGRSIEIYSGRVAIDIFSNDEANALLAAKELRPLNAPGSASADLPAPVYCPGLYGAESEPVAHAMANLPNHVCQSSLAEERFAKEVEGPRAPAAHQ
jgi:hypothetical protein